MSSQSEENDERIQYLLDQQKKIHEVMFYCEEIYTCRHQLLSRYYAWPGDLPSQQCNKCDNCLRYLKDNPILCDINVDVYKMLEVVESVTNFLNNQQKEASRQDIMYIFCQAKNKVVNEKNLSELQIYKDNWPRKIKKQDDALHLLDWLIIEGLVVCDIILQKPNPNFSNLVCNLIICGLKDGAIVDAQSREWKYLLKT